MARDGLREDGHDLDAIYPRLAVAAVRRSKVTRHGPDVARWQFDLPRHFVEGAGHNSALGVAIARAMYDYGSTDYSHLTHYARILRKAGRAGEALQLLSTNAINFRGRRDVLIEWATAAGEVGDVGLSIWLAARIGR